MSPKRPHPSLTGFEALSSRLRSCTKADLVALIGAMYQASPANRVLLHDHLGLPAPVPDPERLDRDKDKLARYVAPDPGEDFQPGAALEVIEHYATSTGDRRGTVDLALCCLERGADAMEAYGDLFEEFYDALLEVADRCAAELNAEPALIDAFLPRVDAIRSRASGVGWGYGDTIEYTFGGLARVERS